MAGELAGKKVLLVDDDRDILAGMREALEDLGPEILTASNGDEAVAQTQEHHPDLVVLDMMLPKRSGFVVMQQLRTVPKPPRVIMITGNPGSRHKVYAESLGIDIYLNKPFHMEQLVNSVKSLLGVADEES